MDAVARADASAADVRASPHNLATRRVCERQHGQIKATDTPSTRAWRAWLADAVEAENAEAHDLAALEAIVGKGTLSEATARAVVAWKHG